MDAKREIKVRSMAHGKSVFKADETEEFNQQRRNHRHQGVKVILPGNGNQIWMKTVIKN